MHYYTRAGKPAHFEGKDGKATTLREARKLDLLPSVTTILNVVDKPQLTAWKQREAIIKAAHLITVNNVTPPTDPDELQAWASGVISASREDTLKKADEGTVIHDVLEQYWNGETDGFTPELMRLGEQVEALIKEKTGLENEDFQAEAYVVHQSLGFAGMCDLSSIPGNDEWVIDYKTKDKVGPRERGYANQAEQLAAYGKGMGMKSPRLANIFIQRDPVDGEWALCWYEHKDPMAWHRFHAALYLWQVSKKFGPLYAAVLDES